MTMLGDVSRILNQPPWWLSSAFTLLLGAVVGLFSGLVGQSIVIDMVGRRNMRRVLYRDLAQMFWAVERFTGPDVAELGAPTDADCSEWRQDQLRRFLFFLGEKYCMGNPALYVQLPERFASQELYPRFHRLLEDPADSLQSNTRGLRLVFVDYVHDGSLATKYLKKYLGRKKARELLRVVEGYRKEHDDQMQRLRRGNS